MEKKAESIEKAETTDVSQAQRKIQTAWNARVNSNWIKME